MLHLIFTFFPQSVLDPRLPFLLLASLSALCALLPLFLPETAGVELPDTVEDVENFGSNNGFFHVPWIEERRQKKEAKRRKGEKHISC